MRPKPRAGTRGPFLPSVRSGIGIFGLEVDVRIDRVSSWMGYKFLRIVSYLGEEKEKELRIL